MSYQARINNVGRILVSNGTCTENGFVPFKVPVPSPYWGIEGLNDVGMVVGLYWEKAGRDSMHSWPLFSQWRSGLR